MPTCHVWRAISSTDRRTLNVRVCAPSVGVPSHLEFAAQNNDDYKIRLVEFAEFLTTRLPWASSDG